MRRRCDRAQGTARTSSKLQEQARLGSGGAHAASPIVTALNRVENNEGSEFEAVGKQSLDLLDAARLRQLGGGEFVPSTCGMTTEPIRSCFANAFFRLGDPGRCAG